MLVLSRRVGESLVIGENITITVLEQRGDVVRIGVDAPRHIQVRRQELLAEVAETNRSAASPAAGAVAGLSRLMTGAEAPRPESPDRSGAAQAAPVARPRSGPGPTPRLPPGDRA